MLGILLIYVIGKQFYDLAIKHQRSAWGFAIFGVVAYYGGTFIGGLLLGVLAILIDWNIEGIHDLALGLMTLPFGLFITWLAYILLKKKWENIESNTDSDILDAGLS